MRLSTPSRSRTRLLRSSSRCTSQGSRSRDPAGLTRCRRGPGGRSAASSPSTDSCRRARRRRRGSERVQPGNPPQTARKTSRPIPCPETGEGYHRSPWRALLIAEPCRTPGRARRGVRRRGARAMGRPTCSGAKEPHAPVTAARSSPTSLVAPTYPPARCPASSTTPSVSARYAHVTPGVQTPSGRPHGPLGGSPLARRRMAATRLCDGWTVRCEAGARACPAGPAGQALAPTGLSA